jgi:hypothetical protein
MTCRACVASPNDEVSRRAFELEPLLRELAQSGRHDDFCWLARSQGVGPEKIERLWVAMSALVAGEA